MESKKNADNGIVGKGAVGLSAALTAVAKTSDGKEFAIRHSSGSEEHTVDFNGTELKEHAASLLKARETKVDKEMSTVRRLLGKYNEFKNSDYPTFNVEVQQMKQRLQSAF
jgi:hypothetical protein